MQLCSFNWFGHFENLSVDNIAFSQMLGREGGLLHSFSFTLQIAQNHAAVYEWCEVPLWSALKPGVFVISLEMFLQCQSGSMETLQTATFTLHFITCVFE